MRILREMLILGIAAFLVIYLINPTAGFIELLPDNLPLVGNLDEATAVIFLLRILAYYGINVGWLINQPQRPPSTDK